MQDHLEDKSVALIIKGAKITGRTLAKAMQAFLKRTRDAASKHRMQSKQGKQSVRSLTKQGASLSSVEITGNNIGTFRRTARKYNIDFALKRDDSGPTPKWMVFFKAKDTDALTAAFKEYSTSILKEKQRKPSILSKLSRFKEVTKSVASPVKNRSKVGHEI